MPEMLRGIFLALIPCLRSRRELVLENLALRQFHRLLDIPGELGRTRIRRRMRSMGRVSAIPTCSPCRCLKACLLMHRESGASPQQRVSCSFRLIPRFRSASPARCIRIRSSPRTHRVTRTRQRVFIQCNHSYRRGSLMKRAGDGRTFSIVSPP